MVGSMKLVRQFNRASGRTRHGHVRLSSEYVGHLAESRCLRVLLALRWSCLPLIQLFLSVRPLEADFGQGMGPVEREHLAFVLLGVAIVPFGAVQNNTRTPQFDQP